MPKVICVVEDSTNIRNIVDFMLKNYGYEVALAADGDSGLKLVMEKKPDLVVLDVMLPGKDGFEICKTLKSDPRYKDIKIVLLTAIAKDIAHDENYWKEKTQADAYIPKPFKAKDVIERIKNLIGEPNK